MLALLTIATYIPSMGSGFIWDDPQYVIDNPTLKTVSGLWSIWTDPQATPQYYPMVHSSFWIEARLWGTKIATGFHIDNILLHALAVVLLWRSLRAIGVPWPGLAAAIFAVHPVMVESVAWVTERKNVLSIVFYLLAFHAYSRSGLLRFDKAPDIDPGLLGAPRKGLAGSDQSPDVHPGLLGNRWYLAALVLFLMALLSKTVTCSLPAAILLIIWWKRGKIAWADVKPLLPMFAIGAGLAAFTGHLEHTQVGARGPDFNWSLVDRCLIAGHAICFYAMKLIWPHPLIFMYPRWNLHDPSGLQFIYPFVVTAAVVGLFIARHRIGRGPLAAVLFFIGTLVPALGFVNVYPMRYSFVADHFQYLASIGLIALIAAALCRLKGPIPPPVISMVVLAPLVVLNVLQQRIYKDQETLWLDTIAQNQTCWMAHVNLASVYQAENRPDEAMRESVLALQLAPNEADTQYNMGVALAKRKQWKDAEWHFREAVKCDPEREYAWSNLARVLWEHVGTPEAQAEALRAAKRALAINPNLADAHYVLARVAEFRGDLQTAIAEYTRALTIAPDDYHTHYNVGVCLLETGRAGEAAGEFQKVLNHDKNDAPAWTDLGYANLDVGRTSDAIACFQRALSIDPGLGPAKEGLKRVTGR